jgi:hypothetical protein
MKGLCGSTATAADLLDALREVGAADAVTVLADRTADSGFFGVLTVRLTSASHHRQVDQMSSAASPEVAVGADVWYFATTRARRRHVGLSRAT